MNLGALLEGPTNRVVLQPLSLLLVPRLHMALPSAQPPTDPLSCSCLLSVSPSLQGAFISAVKIQEEPWLKCLSGLECPLEPKGCSFDFGSGLMPRLLVQASIPDPRSRCMGGD